MDHREPSNDFGSKILSAYLLGVGLRSRSVWAFSRGWDGRSADHAAARLEQQRRSADQAWSASWRRPGGAFRGPASGVATAGRGGDQLRDNGGPPGKLMGSLLVICCVRVVDFQYLARVRAFQALKNAGHCLAATTRDSVRYHFVCD